MFLFVLCCGTLYPILFDHELAEEEPFLDRNNCLVRMFKSLK